MSKRCPDGGMCHHYCVQLDCFRVSCCGPLSGVFPNDTWPTILYKPCVHGLPGAHPSTDFDDLPDESVPCPGGTILWLNYGAAAAKMADIQAATIMGAKFPLDVISTLVLDAGLVEVVREG